MTEDMIIGFVYIAIYFGGFMLLLVLSDGLFNLAYRFIPVFQRLIDRLFDSLPEWDDK